MHTGSSIWIRMSQVHTGKSFWRGESKFCARPSLCPILCAPSSRILLRAAWQRASERARVLPRKFSSHDEVNQIAIAAIAQLPECGARGRGRGRSGSCVMVISTGPNEGGGKGEKGAT